MKKGLIVLMVILGFWSTQAQDNAVAPRQSKDQKLSNEQKAQKAVDKLNSIVGLNNEQQNRVKSAALDKVIKLKAAKAKKKETQNKEAFRTEMKGIQQEYKKQLKTILNKEQWVKLKEYQKSNSAEKKKGENRRRR